MQDFLGAAFNKGIDKVPIGSKVYTSLVDNPFCFEAKGINTLGYGNVMAMATAAKALSQGQFGEFPLYAFTDEGVWAMQLKEDGSYTARQPITRDVCINSDGILQIDSAVLFPTDRGIMLLSGSETQCISENINSETPFDVTGLPLMGTLHSMLGSEHAVDNCIPTVPFLTFIRECRMIYDYVHQRIIVYNPQFTYAYVYSLRSKQWGMMYSDIKASINSYPEALAITNSGIIVDFCKESSVTMPGLLVSRPLKLDSHDILKTVSTVIQRGNFEHGHVQSVLYGSRDLKTWHLVWTSKDHRLQGFRGTPYKYYRIALVCSLDIDEHISGATVQFTPRMTNRIR